MSGRLSTLGLLVQIALRNLFASRLKTLIIGGIILFGTVLVVVGSSLLDSVERQMSRSIQGSVAGHVQIYSAKSKDELALWGNLGGEPDLTAIDDFSRIKKSLETVDNIGTVIPMGISGALIQSGNTIDVTLADLRQAINQQLAGDASPQLRERIDSMKQHVRQMAEVLHSDMKNMKVLASDAAIDPANVEALERATSDGFWAEFDQDPLNALEFLENRVAPQASDADLLFIRYVGTDLDAFQRSFDRMKIVEGQPVPPGQRGFLVSKFFYEERVKLRTARRLDKIKEALDEKAKTIATDEELQRYVRENKQQVREIVLQLDPIKTRTAVERLQTALGTRETDVSRLLSQLLDTDDQNFHTRYDVFYQQIAPLLQLYRIPIGGTLTIKAFTRTGFVQSVNLKVYGTFDFEGLEKSAVAGSLSLMDLVSFRELYGYLTADKAKEFAELKKSVQVQEVTRDSAEDALFGNAATVVAEAVPGVIDDLEKLEGNARALRGEDLVNRVYSRDELEQGVVLNAAVILKDPSQIDETLEAIKQVSDRDGLDIAAVSWQKASGILGQFTLLLKLALYVAVLIIFIVALVVINNAMMMATLERVREIGTLRAIGAQRRFVLQMLMIESLVIGLVFGGLGAGLGVLLVRVIGYIGIPAWTDIVYFFFSGPRLHPELGSSNLVVAFVIVLVVSVLSGFYPAWLAARVSPLQAMQTEE